MVRIALVTGGYRGIGLEIVRSLATQGVTTILTSRDESRGKEAARLLENEGLPVRYHRLDVLDADSITAAASWIQSEFGRLHILINNAGLFSGTLLEYLSLERAEKIIQTNYYGVKRVVEAFLPLLISAEDSRIVNISSASSRLDLLTGDAAEWRNKLLDLEHLTEDTIDSFIGEFYKEVRKGRDNFLKEGWPLFHYPYPGFQPDDLSEYIISKMALNSYTLLLAKKFPELLVNAMCPGLTNTEMSLKTGHPAEEGADTAVWLALECSSSGKFFVQRKARDLVSIPLVCGDKVGDTLEKFAEICLPLVESRVEALRIAGLFKDSE